MNEELSLLKTELEKTRNVLRVQRLRYQQLVTLFSVRIQEKEEETRTQLQTKHVQLTKILRSLYILESRLRKEQRALSNMLSERDVLIKTQQIEVVKLKNELSKLYDRCVCGCVTVTEVSDQSNDSDPASTTTTTTTTATTTLVAVPNKPDLISSIGIERQHSPPQHQQLQHRFDDVSRSSDGGDGDGDFHIPSLDHYDANLTSLSVLDDRRNTSLSNGDSHARKEAGDVVDNHRRLQNERRKFKMKDVGGNAFRNHSPCKILREVTNNPDEKLNGPVLHCVRQILGQPTVITDRRLNGDCGRVGYDQTKCDPKHVTVNGNLTASLFSAKLPSKPSKRYDTIASYETNVPTSKEYLPANPTLTVKPLPKKLTSADDDCFANEQQNFTQSKWTLNGDDTYPIAVVVANSRIDQTKNSASNVAASLADGIDEGVNDESKIVQTVSALLSDSTESDEENSVEMPPTVSQMVKKFEELKREKANATKQANTADVLVQLQMTNSQTDCAIFHTNFEEFHLVDREIESTCEELDKDKRTAADAAETIVTVLRLEAEGEDNKSTSGTVIETSRCLGAAGASGGAGSGGSGAKYETFLEMTGLTQKSILTPSRILSNHRNVMKPKDVKYRSRVKAAVTSEKCANGYAGVATSPTVKYWTEPFL